MLTLGEALDAAFRAYQAGNLPEVEQRCHEILRAVPQCVDALNLLGIVAGRRGASEVAIEYFQRAASLLPAEPQFQRNLASAYQAAGRVTEAIATYREALRLDPRSAVAYTGLAEALVEQGHFEEAIQHNRTALQLMPRSALASYQLAELALQGQYALTAEERRQLEMLADSKDLAAADASLAHFALAGLLDQEGRFEEAFRQYQLGNGAKREVYRQAREAFDPAHYRQLVDRVISTFQPALFERLREMGSQSEVPVFVVGMVRSGTTLVEQILASHPEVEGAGELRDVEQIARALPGRLGSRDPFPECVGSLKAATAREVADIYLGRLSAPAPQARRVIDKMPHNVLYLGLIAALFPRARIIYCRRDPLDLGASIYFQNFKWVPYATSFEDIACFYEQHERLMAHWRRHLPLRITEVAYEDTVADLEGTARRLVAFCDLEWDQRCLAFHRHERPVQTASKLQVRQPIYRSSLGRWKRYDRQLQPLLDRLRQVSESQGTSGSPSG